ncbi:MAG: FecR domain-containing protein, partial [Nitrospira sp.]
WGRGRQVILHTGEAYFTVAKDPARPFEVVALNGHIRDIGTQFAVYRQAERVLVAVESGAVGVALPSTDNGASQTHVLSPGERATYTTAGEWLLLDHVDPRRIAAWRQGTLRFDRIPLRDAIREIERYWTGRILLADPALGAISVSGVFDHRKLEEFFTALPTIIPVHVTHRDGNMILSAPVSSVRP